MKFRTLILGIALGLALCLPIAPGMTAQAAESTVQITDTTQLEPYFPDPIFREAVFKAVKNGSDGAEGKDVVEALYNFRGSVKYNKSSTTPVDQKIKDVHGIEYLRNAETISLKYNEIRDFSWLEKSNDADRTYYGELLKNDPDIAEDARNVVWDFAGNPFEKLPTFFGGRLKIIQPGASSYTYPEDVSQHVVSVRPADSTAVNGTLGINEAIIVATGTKSRDAEVVECTVKERPGDLPTKLVIDSFNDTTANFSKLEKSGVFHVYVGLADELKYATQDEWGGITDGAQSFKYYLAPTFRVYDRITASSAAGGNAELTKTDAASGAPVAGATYEVRTHDGAFVEERTTDASGKLSTSSLLPGDYYLQETAAPNGYLINDEAIPFTVAEGTTDASTTVGGGESQVVTSDGQTVNAAANERLFAGGRDGTGGKGNLMSPDLELSSSSPDDVASVKVTYAKLDGDKGGDNVERTFDTLADAQTDINTEKGDNTILGPVSVTAMYRTSSTAAVQVAASDKPTETIDIPVKKHWQDNPDWHGTRADVTIRLWCNGEEVGTWILTGGTPSEGGADDFDHVFANLPKTDQRGKDLVYEVTEDPVADASGIIGNYISTIDADPTVPNGIVVSNLYNVAEKFHLTGQKSWSGDTEADRPKSVSLTLTQTNASGHAPYIFKTTASAPDWTYTFKNIPLLEGTEKATYQLTETPVNGYTSFVPVANIQGTGDIETVVIPTEQTVNKVKRIEVAGTKTWQDYHNALGTRPAAITVNLYQDDALLDTATATADDGWAYRFADLPEADASGAIHVYTVQEEPVANYTAAIDGTAITNALDPKLNNVASVKGTKTWNDNDDAGKTRPESITVELLDSNGAVAKSVETTAADNWAYAFIDLPKYADDGTEIAYTVREKDVPSGYTATAKGYDLTNTLTEIPQKPKDPTPSHDTPRKPTSIGSAPHKLATTGDAPFAAIAFGATFAAAALAVVAFRKHKRA